MKWFITLTIISGLALFGISTFSGILNKYINLTESQSLNQTGENSSLIQGKDEGVAKKVFDVLLTESEKSEEDIILKGENKDQINFLFLGIGGEQHISGKYLTDTIIIVVFVPSSKKTALISIPRDLLVRSPNGNGYTRVNALYAMPPRGEPEDKGSPGSRGVDYSKEAIKNITGIEVDYYGVLDLQGVEKVVDILGGINVKMNESLKDARFPDKNYGYETLKVKEGWRYMNGYQAVKYIRTRHTVGGDFDRMKRQQEVALAIKNKMEGLKSLSALPKLFSIYEALDEHFTTDLKFNEIMKLMDLAEGAGDDNIIFERITAEEGGELKFDSITWNDQKASVLSPKAGRDEYGEITKRVSEIILSIKNNQ